MGNDVTGAHRWHSGRGGGQNSGMPSQAGRHPIVVLGGGLAGGNAAATLRDEGFRGQVVVISQEPGFPFGRPPLSKTYLRSEEDLQGWYVRPAAWYQQHDIDLRTGCHAVALDTAAHAVVLEGGRELSYQQLLIATGGSNRQLPVAGADLEGIHYLRTVAQCDAIKAEAGPGRRAVVVGMGFIGCEVAASLAQLGVQVTVLFPGKLPLAKVLGDEIGTLIAGFHRANGVELLPGEQVSGFEGGERVEAVATGSGKRVACDFAVVGVGIAAETGALAGSSIVQNDGVLTDELCRTSEPDVYAAGDVANHRHPLFGRVRVEHYNNAEKQGTAAARIMLGSTDPYAYVYTFWSDQYDHKIEYVGHAVTWDDFVVRGSLEDGKLVGFYLLDGVVRAAVGLDRGGDPELDHDGEMAAAGRLVAGQARPARDLLADEHADLWSLPAGA
jgi:3-phenylpropionate/trans-cinnamate dioxygenase ferredoxin reductase component